MGEPLQDSRRTEKSQDKSRDYEKNLTIVRSTTTTLKKIALENPKNLKKKNAKETTTKTLRKGLKRTLVALNRKNGQGKSTQTQMKLSLMLCRCRRQQNLRKRRRKRNPKKNLKNSGLTTWTPLRKERFELKVPSLNTTCSVR